MHGINVKLILLDQNAPRKLAGLLGGHTVITAADQGWSELANGDLLSAAERAHFEVMVTCDRNLTYQQTLAGRAIALVVLSTNAWPVIRDNPAPVVLAVNRACAGSFEQVVFPLPALVRRAWPRPD